jgi:hypothetical protein
MRWREALQRFRKRGKQEGASTLLKQLSAELRSDAVPAVLRDAARTVAALLDGEKESVAAFGTTQGAVIVNVSVAVAVGAPGREQGSGAQREGATPNDAVVVATAVASSPARPGENAPSEGSASAD